MDHGNGETVLIVEDDIGVATLERRRLERAGYMVVQAATAEEAKQRLQQNRVALIVLDHHLPGGVEGLDFYAELKAAGQDVPVIVVTGTSDEAIVIKALRASVRDYFRKSANYLDYLPEAVERVLSQVRVEQQLAESEARLRASEEHLRFALDAARMGTWELDLRNNRITHSPHAGSLLGLSPGGVVGTLAELFQMVHPEDRGKLAISRSIDEGADLRAEFRVIWPDGSVHSLATNGQVYRDVDGHITVMAGIAMDISERKRMEESLRESESRLRAIIENEPQCVKLLAADGTLLDINAAGLAMVEADNLETVKGQLMYPLIAPEHRQAFIAFNERVCRGTPGILEFELIGLRGGRRWLETHAVPLFQSQLGETVQLGITREITEQKKTAEILRRAEEQIRQSQKMEAFGRLAGGVAHDFNNLLTVIMGYARILADNLPPDDPSRHFLDEIRRSGERGATLTRQLTAFSRKQILEPKVLNLNAVVAEMGELLHRLIGEDIALSTLMDPDLGPVMADLGQIEQVIVNLAINARDAMPQGGTLIVKSRNVDLNESNRPADPDLCPGPFVIFTVQDTGCGMDENTRTRIFEPFFTTKEVGKGTGLGLSTVYGIVKQSGGLIDVQSEVGKGTTFRIYLPRLAGEAPALAESAKRATSPRGSETVLVVEDEDTIRSMTCRFLRNAGYTVLDAADGEQALRLCEQHTGPIHLLLTDVIMPRMGGVQLAKRLLALRPDTRVLYVSGYTNDALGDHGVLETDEAFLQKPFGIDDVIQKVREVLDR